MKYIINSIILVINKIVMYQENADSWYITLSFALETLVSGSDVPKDTENLVHH